MVAIAQQVASVGGELGEGIMDGVERLGGGPEASDEDDFALGCGDSGDQDVSEDGGAGADVECLRRALRDDEVEMRRDASVESREVGILPPSGRMRLVLETFEKVMDEA